MTSVHPAEAGSGRVARGGKVFPLQYTIDGRGQMPSPDDADAAPPTPEPADGIRSFDGVGVSDDGSGLGSRNSDAQLAFAAATDDAFTKFLAPFAETFAVLHAVALDEVPTSEAVPELDQVDTEVRKTATNAVETLIVAGGTVGVVSAAVILGVRALPGNPNLVSALTKTVPPNLSRSLVDYATKGVSYTRDAVPKVTAQSKVLFNQAGRNLAKNRGPLALVGLGVASGTLAWAWWADKAEYEAKQEAQRRRQKLVAEAARRDGPVDELNQARLLFKTERTEEAAQVLNRLADTGLSRLPALRDLVAGNDDYATYAPVERLLVAELAGLAETTAAVIASQHRDPPSVELQDRPDADGTLHAAHDVLNRYTRRRNPGSTAAPITAWTAAARNTTSQRNQLTHLLEQPKYLKKLAKRCGNAHQGVQNGFHFEWAHELSFNLTAIGKDSDLRANMTERLGRPHDPADLIIQTPNGDTTRQVQAKVVESNYERVGPKNGLADSKYAGMDLLIPADHVQPTHEFLGEVLDRPADNIYTAAYKDAKGRITDTISSGDISSDPITTGELTAITNHPESHIQKLLSETRRKQAASAGFAAGGTATVMSLATDTTSYLINEGHLNGFNWAQATISAARTGVASAVAASAGNYLQTRAQLAVADGSASLLQESLAHGDHGPGLTQAAIDIAAIAHGLATRRMTPEEAAKAAAGTITESAVIWACTALARRAIPNPEVAALVGGIIGQIGAQLLIQGLRTAVLARDPSSTWDAAYDALIADTAALEFACTAEREELAALTERCRARFAEDILPALERLSLKPGLNAQVAPDPDSTDGSAEALADLAAIAGYFGSAPLFGDLDAFDAFMADSTTTLVLDLGRR
jgi:hypothetical protein